MKVLVVSDLHYTLKQLDWVTMVAGEFDLVVMAGDFLDIGSTPPKSMSTPPRSNNTTSISPAATAAA